MFKNEGKSQAVELFFFSRNLLMLWSQTETIEALLRYNSLIIKWTLLKCTVQWFPVFTEFHNHHCSIILEHFHHSKRKPHTHQSHFPSLSHPPRQPLATTKLLCFCGFPSCTVHPDGVMQTVQSFVSGSGTFNNSANV